MRNPEEEGKKREKKGEKGGCGSSGKGGGKRGRGAKGKAREASLFSLQESCPVRVHRVPHSWIGDAYLFFHPRREKKNSSISASATCDRCYRRHSRGETGRPLPTRGRPRSPTEQVISALPRPRPPASSQGWEKKGPSLGFSPAKAASASALLPPTNGGSLLDGFPLFAMSKRSKMRKCDDVTSEWKAAGQKKTRQSIFQKGRAEGQPAAKC